MKPLALVFARAPRLGTVKRRLAAGIGARAALRFHAETLARTLRRLGRDRRFETRVVVTPDRARGPWLRGLPCLGQGSGDLGQRMGRAFARHPRRVVVLVGCDIPDLAAADVARAAHLLRGCAVVFGPATDGGYWLVGMAGRRPSRLFARVRWSSPHALADTRRNFPGRVRMMRELADVDEPGDVARVVRRAPADAPAAAA